MTVAKERPFGAQASDAGPGERCGAQGRGVPRWPSPRRRSRLSRPGTRRSTPASPSTRRRHWRRPRASTDCARRAGCSAACTACRWRTRTCTTGRASSARAAPRSAEPSGRPTRRLPIKPARASRIDHHRVAQHGGVRAEPDRPQRALRRLPQPLARRPLHRRLLLGLGRSGRRPLHLRSTGVRHRRLDPPASDHVRHHRHQGHADARLPLRRHAALLLCRQRRTARTHSARLRAPPARDRRP